MKVKLTYVRSEEKTSQGGKKYTSVSIKTQQHGEKFLNGFGSKETSSWKEGDEVEVNVVEKEYNGKTYLNFEVPNKDDKISRALEFLKDDVQAVKTECQMIRGQIADLVDYLKKNQVAFGTTKPQVTTGTAHVATSGTYPQPTPAQHNAMAQNNHFAGGLGYITDDRGTIIETIEYPSEDINPDDIPFN